MPNVCGIRGGIENRPSRLCTDSAVAPDFWQTQNGQFFNVDYKENIW